jgi:hypothetical protein
MTENALLAAYIFEILDGGGNFTVSRDGQFQSGTVFAAKLSGYFETHSEVEFIRGYISVGLVAGIESANIEFFDKNKNRVRQPVWQEFRHGNKVLNPDQIEEIAGT